MTSRDGLKELAGTVFLFLGPQIANIRNSGSHIRSFTFTYVPLQGPNFAFGNAENPKIQSHVVGQGGSTGILCTCLIYNFVRVHSSYRYNTEMTLSVRGRRTD